jgi:hypothetical protein
MRGVTEEFSDYLETGLYRIVNLVEGDFEDGMVRLTNHIQNIVYDGNTYYAGGNLLSIGNLEETLEMQANTTDLKLSGINPDVIGIVRDTVYVGNPVRMYIALCNERWEVDTTIPDNPFLIVEGNMDKMTLSINSQTSEITIPVINHWARFDDRKGRQTNPTLERRLFPDCAIFDQVPTLLNKEIEF